MRTRIKLHRFLNVAGMTCDLASYPSLDAFLYHIYIKYRSVFMSISLAECTIVFELAARLELKPVWSGTLVSFDPGMIEG